MSLADVPRWVRSYIGIPYLEGGTDRKGLDCFGLYNMVLAEQFGMHLPPYEGPTPATGARTGAILDAAGRYAAQFSEIGPQEARIGDAILLRGVPLHLGMVVGRHLMLHVEECNPSLIDRYNSVKWSNRIVSFYRFTPDERPHADQRR